MRLAFPLENAENEKAEGQREVSERLRSSLLIWKGPLGSRQAGSTQGSAPAAATQTAWVLWGSPVLAQG